MALYGRPRYFNNRIKKVMPEMTIVKYAAWLGLDPTGKRLVIHQTTVTASIRYIIDKGGNVLMKVDWEGEVKKLVLTLSRTTEAKIKRPGYFFIQSIQTCVQDSSHM